MTDPPAASNKFPTFTLAKKDAVKSENEAEKADEDKNKNEEVKQPVFKIAAFNPKPAAKEEEPSTKVAENSEAQEAPAPSNPFLKNSTQATTNNPFLKSSSPQNSAASSKPNPFLNKASNAPATSQAPVVSPFSTNT